MYWRKWMKVTQLIHDVCTYLTYPYSESNGEW
jgi:hypothetical protein